jgi:beta-phosphoglucomutase
MDLIMIDTVSSSSIGKISAQAVIFDMDGVITNTMPVHYKAWRKILAEEGISVTHLDIYSREGQRGITSLKEIFAVYQKEFSEEVASRLLHKKEEWFKEHVKCRFISGTRSLLKDLTKLGLRLALVTGTSRQEMHRILPDNLYQLFAVVVTGNDVTHGKPDPEPYRLALKKLEILPEDAVVIENAPLGIESAKAAGIRCVAISTSLPASYLTKADMIFPSIKQLREKIMFIKSPSLDFAANTPRIIKTYENSVIV